MNITTILLIIQENYWISVTYGHNELFVKSPDMNISTSQDKQ